MAQLIQPLLFDDPGPKRTAASLWQRPEAAAVPNAPEHVIYHRGVQIFCKDPNSEQARQVVEVVDNLPEGMLTVALAAVYCDDTVRHRYHLRIYDGISNPFTYGKASEVSVAFAVGITMVAGGHNGISVGAAAVIPDMTRPPEWKGRRMSDLPDEDE